MPMPLTFLTSSRFLAGVATLLEAYDAARDSGATQWDFALELPVLAEAGLDRTHLRWLIRKGHLEHGLDRIPRYSRKRSVRRVNWLRFQHDSCFILTRAGVKFVRSVGLTGARSIPPSPAHDGAPIAGIKGVGGEKPHWDTDRMQLFFRGEVILEFKRAAPNPRKILDCFENAGWIPRIKTPFVHDGDGNAKTRLHNAINTLNRRQIVQLIHFSGDGLGDGVEWKIVANGTVPQSTSRTSSLKRIRQTTRRRAS